MAEEEPKLLPVGAGSTDQWTALRCDLLIQALKRRVEMLKKDAGQHLKTTEVGTASQISNGAVVQQVHTRKRKHKTYSSRSRNQTPAASTYYLAVNDPSSSLLKLAGGLGEKHDSCSLLDPAGAELGEQSCVKSMHGPAYFTVRQAMRRVQATMRSDTFDLYLTLFKSYEGLLIATQRDESSDRPRALLACSLRALANHMQLKGECSSGRHKPYFGASDLTYSAFQGDRILGDEGWDNLQLLVRAHATDVVCKAIEEGVLCHQFGSIFAMMCFQRQSFVEAEAIITSLMHHVHPGEPTSEHSRHTLELSPIAVLHDFGIQTGRTSYYRHVTSLFEDKQLPIGWLATTEYRQLLPGLLSHLREQDQSNDDLKLLQVVLSRLSEAVRSPSSHDGSKERCKIVASLHRIYTSLLADLCSIGFLSENSHSMEMIDDILHCHITQQLACCRPSSSCGSVYLATFAALSLGNNRKMKCVERSDLLSLLEQQTRDSPTVSSQGLADLFAKIMESCEKASSGAGRRVFESLLRSLDLCSEGVLGQNDAACTLNSKILPEVIAKAALSAGMALDMAILKSFTEQWLPLFARKRTVKPYNERASHREKWRSPEAPPLTRFVDLVPSSPSSDGDYATGQENRKRARKDKYPSTNASYSSMKQKDRRRMTEESDKVMQMHGDPLLLYPDEHPRVGEIRKLHVRRSYEETEPEGLSMMWWDSASEQKSGVPGNATRGTRSSVSRSSTLDRTSAATASASTQDPESSADELGY